MVLKCYRDWKISLSLHGWLKNMTSYSHFKLKKNMKDNWCTLLIASNIHKVSKECISTFSQPGLFLEKHIVSQRRRGKKAKQADKVCLYGDERSRERAHPNMLTKLSRFWLIKILLLLSSHTSFFTMTSLAWHRWADWIWCEYVPLLMKCCPHVVNDCTRHLVSVWIFYTDSCTIQYSITAFFFF